MDNQSRNVVTGPKMSYDDNVTTLQCLLDRAHVIEADIETAISSTEDENLEALSTQFEEIASAILSFSITSFTDLKHKYNFGQKLLLPDHNDPGIVSDIFTKLINDIEKLDEIYSA